MSPGEILQRIAIEHGVGPDLADRFKQVMSIQSRMFSIRAYNGDGFTFPEEWTKDGIKSSLEGLHKLVDLPLLGSFFGESPIMYSFSESGFAFGLLVHGAHRLNQLNYVEVITNDAVRARALANVVSGQKQAKN